MLDDGGLPDLQELAARFAPRDAAPPTIVVQLPAIAVYDTLLAGMEARP